MAWIVLLVSAVCEAVWATALGASHGLTRPVPSLVFAIGLVVSMAGLGWAAKHIPIGTAYAVWTGVGAALTVGFAMATGTEEATVWRILFLTGIVLAVTGLKLLPETPRRRPAPPASQREPEDG
ncbi:DMT family transporter [Propionicicella superfundia]|uniref:DMT family transporter n=1 Tax=Propionicicella superfundia TaxID=348582 RepID=UPI0003F69B84|nr:multidrug efflux SMR transporter [Propionicicella superfundia]